jgi:hypothetical protein
MMGQISFVSRQRFTSIGWMGVVCLMAPAIVTIIVAFQQQATLDSYLRTLRVNETLARQGGGLLTADLPMDLPATFYAALGAVALAGFILVVVGRENVSSGSMTE